MKYLFFDIECANCWQNIGKICSFGYVITDENFNLLAKKDIIINPKAKFDYRGLSIAGIKLAYSEEQYKNAPSFDECYGQIKSLITSKDHVVCGHSTSSDAKYILDECKRYNKEPFDYIYIDTIKLIKLIYQREKDLSLSVLYNEFYQESENLEAHKSDDDAFMTMKIAQFITLDKNLTFNQVISQNTLAKGEVFFGRIVDKDTTVFSYSAVSNKTRNSNSRIFEQAKKEQKVDKKGDLFPKKYCIEHTYENNNFAQMLLIISKLNRSGGRYVSNVALTDVYVVKGKSNQKLDFLPSNVKVISFAEFIKQIKLNKLDLLTDSIDCDELIGNFESNKEWYIKYQKDHVMLHKIEQFIYKDNFECSVDFPVIQYFCAVGEKKTYRFYDPVLNGIFTRHPYRVNRGSNSYLPSDAYEQAIEESESRVFANIKRSFAPKKVEVTIKETYNYIVSYKFLGKFVDNKIDFTIYEEIIADKSFEKSIKINREAINIDLNGAIMRYYNSDLLSMALKAMSKFNFGYKSDIIVEEENVTIKENDIIHLPKKYYEEFIKEDKVVQGNIIVNKGSMFIPTTSKFDNNLFAQKITLPVVIERKI